MTILARTGLSLLAVAAPAAAVGLFLAVLANALAEDTAQQRVTVEAETAELRDEQQALTADYAALRSTAHLRDVAADLGLARPGDHANEDDE